MSVRPSVCPSHSGIVSKRTNEHDFFTDEEPEDSDFCRYQVRPKIRKGSPRGRTLCEGVGRNGRFSAKPVWKFVELRRYCPQQICSPETLVSGDARLPVFTGVPEEGASNRRTVMCNHTHSSHVCCSSLRLIKQYYKLYWYKATMI